MCLLIIASTVCVCVCASLSLSPTVNLLFQVQDLKKNFLDTTNSLKMSFGSDKQCWKYSCLTQQGGSSLHCAIVNVLVLRRQAHFVPQDVNVEKDQVVTRGVKNPPQAPKSQVRPLQNTSQLQQHLDQYRVLPARHGAQGRCSGRRAIFRVHVVHFWLGGHFCQLFLLLAFGPVEEQGAFRPRQQQGEQQAEADEAQRHSTEGVVRDVAQGQAQLPHHRAGEHPQEHRGAGVTGHALVLLRFDQGEDVRGVRHTAGHRDPVEELHELHLQEGGAQQQNDPDGHLTDALDDQDRLVAHEICQEEGWHQHHHVGVREYRRDLIGHLRMEKDTSNSIKSQPICFSVSLPINGEII